MTLILQQHCSKKSASPLIEIHGLRQVNDQNLTFMVRNGQMMRNDGTPLKSIF